MPSTYLQNIASAFSRTVVIDLTKEGRRIAENAEAQLA